MAKSEKYHGGNLGSEGRRAKALAKSAGESAGRATEGVQKARKEAKQKLEDAEFKLNDV
ncbi:hypothetical protein HY969_02895 [Candidatus Kaiserbacteria bacterium]|nr:hypothetical protein [Candidatus Kaiserbacteria bacterium]